MPHGGSANCQASRCLRGINPSAAPVSSLTLAHSALQRHISHHHELKTHPQFGVRTVSYKLVGSQFGIEPGYCMSGVEQP